MVTDTIPLRENASACRKIRQLSVAGLLAETMRRIQQGERGRNEDEDFSFISEKRALELFKDTPEAVDNSRAIADRCNVSFELGKWTFPAVPVSPGFNTSFLTGP